MRDKDSQLPLKGTAGDISSSWMGLMTVSCRLKKLVAFLKYAISGFLCDIKSCTPESIDRNDPL